MGLQRITAATPSTATTSTAKLNDSVLPTTSTSMTMKMEQLDDVTTTTPYPEKEEEKVAKEELELEPQCRFLPHLNPDNISHQTTVESILMEELELRFIDARSLTTTAKLQLCVKGYPSKHQKIQLANKCMDLFFSLPLDAQLSMRQDKVEFDSIKDSMSIASKLTKDIDRLSVDNSQRRNSNESNTNNRRMTLRRRSMFGGYAGGGGSGNMSALRRQNQQQRQASASSGEDSNFDDGVSRLSSEDNMTTVTRRSDATRRSDSDLLPSRRQRRGPRRILKRFFNKPEEEEEGQELVGVGDDYDADLKHQPKPQSSRRRRSSHNKEVPVEDNTSGAFSVSADNEYLSDHFIQAVVNPTSISPF